MKGIWMKVLSKDNGEILEIIEFTPATRKDGKFYSGPQMFFDNALEYVGRGDIVILSQPGKGGS